MKPCSDCQATRESPLWPMHCPTCLWCGARLIQRIQALRTIRPAQEIRERCRKVLDDWMSYGHSEKALRELASGTSLPLQPTGPEEAGASADPSPEKPRSRRAKRSTPSRPLKPGG